VEKRRDFEHDAEEIEQLFADLWQVFPFSRALRRGFRPQVDVYRTDDPPTLTSSSSCPASTRTTCSSSLVRARC
jgi:hypothetical protein